MKQVINPDQVSKPVGHYSHCIRASGQLVFIAGQVAVDQQGQLVGKGDIEAQTWQVMKNIEAIVRAAGGTMDDIVQTVIYDTDIAKHVDTMRRVADRFFGASFPASTKVEVKRLAHPDYLIEISAIAVIG